LEKEILNAIKNLLESHSINQLTINEIAKEAKVSRQTVYRYFGDKENLIKKIKDENLLGDFVLDTKNLIIEAAYKVFAEFGYEETTLDQIGYEAGFTKGAIYGHFSNKNELFITLIEKKIVEQLRFVPSLLQEAITKVNFVQGLTNYFENQLSYIESNPKWTRLLLEFMVHSRNEDIQNQLNRIYVVFEEQTTSMVKEMQEKGLIYREVDPSILATLVSSLLDGMAMRWLLCPNQVKLKSLSYQVADILWKGISPR